jgi:hypothetical protein
MHSKRLAMIAIGLVLTGCTSAPTMKYAAYSYKSDKTVATQGTDEEGSVKFYLYGSLVTLVDGSQATPAPAPAVGAGGKDTAAKTDKETPPPDASAQAATLLKAQPRVPVLIKTLEELKAKPAKAVPSKKIDDETLYALVPKETFYYKPNISVSYVTNSYAIKTLGAAAEDNRVQIIQAVGGALTALAPLVLALDASPASPAPVQSALPLPVVIDLTPVDFGRADAGSCVYSASGGASEVIPDANWCAITGTKGDWQYVVQVKALTPGTTDRDKFFAQAEKSEVRLFPVPVCQNVTLSVRPKGTAEHMDFDLTVADPRRVATFRVPSKGSITPGDVCGADLTVSASTSTSAADVANAVAKQAAAIQKALQAGDPATSSKPKPKA